MSLMPTTLVSSSEWSNSTSIAPLIVTDLPVIGLPGMNFWILHITAEVSLSISIIASFAVFGILRPTCPGFWLRPIGERFAVYLALSDLLYSISHVIDHAYMMAIMDHPPDAACAAMAYFVGTFIVVQAMMVTFMSLNAYILVVKERKISLGSYDWRFLLVTVGVPIAGMIPCGPLGLLGPSGGWCLYNVRVIAGRLLAVSLVIIQLITIMVNVVSYIFIYYKIRQVTAATAAMGHTSDVKYGKTARVMMKFVAAFIFQWWIHPVYAFWNLVVMPPFIILHTTVLLVNMGGLYNLIVYTLLRKKPKPKKDNDIAKSGKGAMASQNTSATNVSVSVAGKQ